MTPEQLQVLAAEAFQNYSRTWGKPERQEFIVVTRAIESMVKAVYDNTQVSD